MGRAVCRIPGMQYNSRWKRGRLPLTPYTAKLVIDAYPDAYMPEEIVQLAKAVDKVPSLRQAANNPALPEPDSALPWWEHQKQAFWCFMKLYQAGFRGAGLFSELGTGKSKVAIGVADALGVKLGLVVGPRSSRLVWHDQFRKHSNRDYQIILPDMTASIRERHRRIRVRLSKAHPEQPIIIVMNYDGVWRPPFGSWALDQNWDIIIADELHRIKDPRSKVSNFMALLGDRADFRLGLTGTPLHNRPRDIWAQYRFIDPGVYGLDYKAFNRRYASITGDESASSELEAEFANKLYSISFRAKGDLKLPATTEQIIRGELEESRAAYKKLETAIKMDIRAGRITIHNALTRLIRLQQATSGYTKDDDRTMHILGHEKERIFDDFMMDYPKGEPLLVFAQFHYDLDVIERITNQHKLRYAEYSGRRGEVQKWLKGRADVLGVQIRAGAESVDFTRARHCLYYSMGLSWGDYRQSKKRIHRAGQTREVNYIYLLLAGTIDERIFRIMRNRGDVIEALLDEYRQN